MEALVRRGAKVVRWQPYEIEFYGPADGNPFVEVALRAEFRYGGRTLTAQGFYDGDGVDRVRIMPDEEGRWRFRTISETPSLDGHTGAFDCQPAVGNGRGPVRVHNRFHFSYADGTRYLPVGTTAYAWTHQPEQIEELTLVVSGSARDVRRTMPCRSSSRSPRGAGGGWLRRTSPTASRRYRTRS